VQCNATFRALDKAGVHYTKIDITDDDTALVYVSPALHWSGFRPDRLRRLTDSAA
jgi:glutaredoxin-like protein NrdH